MQFIQLLGPILIVEEGLSHAVLTQTQGCEPIIVNPKIYRKAGAWLRVSGAFRIDSIVFRRRLCPPERGDLIEVKSEMPSLANGHESGLRNPRPNARHPEAFATRREAK